MSRGQVTIFIIVAIIIVASIAAYFLFRGTIQTSVPKEILPAYNYFLSCIEDETNLAASLMESQAGYLDPPEFEAGSVYAPFSSYLNFMNTGVPYWYYISGNGVAKEQIPSKEKMKAQLEEYLDARVAACDFKQFEAQGFAVEKGAPKVSANIGQTKITLDINMPLTISFGSQVSRLTSHKVSVDSKLGKFYDIAKKIYNKEKNSEFLENYGIDVLRLYAPVDGVEMTCSPKVWMQSKVKDEFKQALEANTGAIKVKGSYYALTNKEDNYFVQDIGDSISEQVNFAYSPNWPTRVEIYPNEDPMIAEPVGLQEGLGILGFCYVPYHFVYDVSYPVLIQIYDNEEMFQFPVAVVIDKNKAAHAIDTEALPEAVPELCEHKLTQMQVSTYNTKLEPVNANISFKCFDTSCDIGETNPSLNALFPQCVNGYIIASAEGYSTKNYLISSVQSGQADIILDKLYNLDLDVLLNGVELTDEQAIIYLTEVNGTNNFAFAYPEQKKISLSEGQYEVEVYVYKNSTISFPGTTTTKCVETAQPGIGGIFGATKENCFDINVPSQTVSFAIAGGGKTNYYFVESELESSKTIKINAQSLPAPTSLEQLQNNYNLLDEKSLWVELI